MAAASYLLGRLPVLGEALVTKPREIQQTRRREAASVKVPRQALGQGLLDRVGVPPELEGHDDVSKEPLEQQALEDARLALEALAIGARALVLEPDPEEVGTPGHLLGKGRRDPAGVALTRLSSRQSRSTHRMVAPLGLGTRRVLSRRNYRRSRGGYASDRCSPRRPGERPRPFRATRRVRHEKTARDGRLTPGRAAQAIPERGLVPHPFRLEVALGSIAAMQPVPAAVTPGGRRESCTSPAANTPGTDVWVVPGVDLDVAVRVHLELALEELGVRLVADRDEDPVGRKLRCARRS